MMGVSPVISDQARWQNVLLAQKTANAERWLTLLETSHQPAHLVHVEYDNFLKALETTLQSPSTFDVAYRLGQILYPIIFGYADWDRWLVYLQQTLHTSKILHRKNAEARLLEQIGDLLYHKGDLEDAEKSYYTASQLYEGKGNLISYSRILAMMASLKDIQGKVDEGIHLCHKALETAENAQDDLALANANLNLANIYRRARDWDRALEAAQTAYTHYHKVGHTTLLTKASITLIALWAELKDWDKINQLSKELMTVLDSSGDVHNLSQLKNNMGISAFSQGNYNLAEASWQEALQLHSQIQEPTELAGIYNNLGMVYTQLKEWTAAEKMLNKAIIAYDKFGDIYNWANSMDNLADLHKARGELTEFKRILQEAIAGLQVIEDASHAKELLDYMQKRLQTREETP